MSFDGVRLQANTATAIHRQERTGLDEGMICKSTGWDAKRKRGQPHILDVGSAPLGSCDHCRFRDGGRCRFRDGGRCGFRDSRQHARVDDGGLDEVRLRMLARPEGRSDGLKHTIGYILGALLMTVGCGSSESPASDTTTQDAGTDEASDNQPPTLEWTKAPATIEIATTLELAGASTDADGDTLSETWTVTSTTAPGFDCSDLVRSQATGQARLQIPGDVDERCGDRLEVTWKVSDGIATSTLTHEVEVVPTPGRVSDFEAVAGNPQPEMGGCPTWHCLNHADPTLGRLPDGSLAIWAATSGAYDDPTYQQFPVVGRFVQQAGGVWVADEQPSLDPLDVPQDAWALARETPSVRWNNDVQAWDMWFLGYREDYFTDPAIGQLRSADSEGAQWGSSESPVYRPSPGAWDEDFITSPGAVHGSDGVWRLYYAGASFSVDNGRMRVGVLTSEDGQTWNVPEEPVVFEGTAGRWDEGILDPHVQFVGGRYVMWYTGYVPPLDVESDQLIAVGVAVSEDGYSFERLADEPILSPEPDSWMDKRVLDVEVLREPDGSLLMVGYGQSKTQPHPFNADWYPGRLGFWRSP